jgi:hypothetical protein
VLNEIVRAWMAVAVLVGLLTVIVLVRVVALVCVELTVVGV